MSHIHLHCVSDSTGDTIRSVAVACLARFEGTQATEHLWPLARTPKAIDRVVEYVAQYPGPVLFTLVNDALRERLAAACRRLEVPCISVMDPVTAALGAFLGRRPGHQPGRQHVVDAAYFQRIGAIDWAISHDDGQAMQDLETADVVLVAVSRCSKTPTCLYLANRGIRAANVPLVPGLPPAPALLALRRPLMVGLVNDAKRLVEIRRSRLRGDERNLVANYTDMATVRAELAASRRFFNDNGWPVIDVTRRSIEETAASVLQLLHRHRHGA